MTQDAKILAPCPFCGRELYRKKGALNPAAYCKTEGCYGSKMPVVNLDVPEDVEAWNRRALRDGDATEGEPVAWQHRTRGRYEGAQWGAWIDGRTNFTKMDYEERPLFLRATLTRNAEHPVGASEARRILSEMTSIRWGCSGLSLDYVNDWFNERAAAALAALVATPPAQTAAVNGEVVAYASAGQIEGFEDHPGDEGGVYIPLRKTPVGNFQMPLYTRPTAPDAGVSEALTLIQSARATRDAGDSKGALDLEDRAGDILKALIAAERGSEPTGPHYWPDALREAAGRFAALSKAPAPEAVAPMGTVISDAMVERALDGADYIPNADNRKWMRTALEAALSASTGTVGRDWEASEIVSLRTALATEKEAREKAEKALREAHHELSCCDDISLDKGLVTGISELQADRDRLRSDLLERIAARPLRDWHDDDGFVVWWTWRDGRWLGEPSYIGSPLCSDWPEYHTHWTPHPVFPAALSAPTGEGEALAGGRAGEDGS